MENHSQAINGESFITHAASDSKKQSLSLTDQHAGALIPTATQQLAIQNVLNPTSAASGAARQPWNGAAQPDGSLTSAAITARNQLQTELTAALNEHLDASIPEATRVAARRKLPMTSFEGAGRLAKSVTDAQFDSWTAAAALTTMQRQIRQSHQFRATGKKQNLFDATDPISRQNAGLPINCEDLASWIAETDAQCRQVQQSYHFNSYRSHEEEDFLYTQILEPFVKARRADLLLYDQYLFAMADAETGRIIVSPQVMEGFPDVLEPDGTASPAERATKWKMWKVLIHEYLHTLEHPISRLASRGNRIIHEGFCEMFTKEVLLTELPKVATPKFTLAQNKAYTAEIEGGHYTEATPLIIGDYDPKEYKNYLTQAETIRDDIIGKVGGSNAVKAAYFQGHVEFLGLNPDGSLVTPAPIGGKLVVVPLGIRSLDELATATGVAKADILAANPTLTAFDPLPIQLHIPSCREHYVVEATDNSGNRTSETRTQIATQNGVTETQLNRANPGVDWTRLMAGQLILIPRH